MSYDKIPGYSGFLPLYDRAVEEAKDGAVFVEVGVALGHSLAYLARLVRDSGKRIEVWAVDPWEGGARNGEQQEALGGAGELAPVGVGAGDFGLFLSQMRERCPEELEIVRVVRAPSKRAARLFDVQSVDFVLIDAAHDEASVFSDVNDWLPRVRPGGTIAGDDHEPRYPGVQAACMRIFDTYEVIGTAWRKVMP